MRIGEEHHADAPSVCRPLRAVPVSPIDSFYSYIGSLVPLGKEEKPKASDVLGKVLMLGIVSATEHYFRAVLAGSIRVCPFAGVGPHRRWSLLELSSTMRTETWG